MDSNQSTLPTTPNQQPLSPVSSVDESFEVLRTLFQPRNAFAVEDRPIEYHITGNDGGVWTVRVHNRSCEIQKGEATDADFVLSATKDDWLDIVNGKLVSDFGRFTIRRKGPPKYDEDSEDAITWDQAAELRALGLLGREFTLPHWASRAGLTEASELEGFTSKYGELDHGEFLKNPPPMGTKNLAVLLRAKDFRRVTRPVAALIFCRRLLLSFAFLIFPAALLVGWEFGRFIGSLAGLVLFFVPAPLVNWTDEEARRRLDLAARQDAEFFRYAMEHAILKPIPQCDKPDLDRAIFLYFFLGLPSLFAVLIFFALSRSISP